MQDRIANLMEKLKCTESEALDIIKTDEEIEKGANPFPLSADQEKASKKARAVSRAVGVYKFDKKERKADLDKSKLIADLIDGIPYAENIEVTNKEREFLFTYNGKKYKVVLSAPRK
jgi:hypothetical protein